MLSITEIQKFIDDDGQSKRKRHAKTGLRYYEGDHDIKKYRIFFIDENGKVQEDKTKSNIKIPHPFFQLLVNQQAQYIYAILENALCTSGLEHEGKNKDGSVGKYTFESYAEFDENVDKDILPWTIYYPNREKAVAGQKAAAQGAAVQKAN